jgi:hypothetical protein
MRYLKQVNNIRVFIGEGGTGQCRTKDGKVLEDFRTIECAIKWATKTKDFLRRKKCQR